MTRGNLPLLDLLYSAVVEYQLLENIILENIGLSILIARLDFIIYIFVEDAVGLHCVEFSNSIIDINERASYWKNKLESGIKDVLTYKIPKALATSATPDALKFTQRTLVSKSEK